MVPICNICHSEMKERIGKYGLFYYCPNHCKNQKCVSGTFWAQESKRLKTQYLMKVANAHAAKIKQNSKKKTGHYICHSCGKPSKAKNLGDLYSVCCNDALFWVED